MSFYIRLAIMVVLAAIAGTQSGVMIAGICVAYLVGVWQGWERHDFVNTNS